MPAVAEAVALAPRNFGLPEPSRAPAAALLVDATCRRPDTGAVSRRRGCAASESGTVSVSVEVDGRVQTFTVGERVALGRTSDGDGDGDGDGTLLLSAARRWCAETQGVADEDCPRLIAGAARKRRWRRRGGAGETA